MNDAGQDKPEAPVMGTFQSTATDILDTVDYPSGYYHHLNPHHINLVCSINGLKGPSLDDGFTYCEIGCGDGTTPNILAAANPNGRFYGIDVSSQRIDLAKATAASGKLPNIEFLHNDISELDTGNLPMFDYITLHGVYSWVPEDVQRAIMDFIAAKLSPGGCVLLSYNTLPGWGGAIALRKYFTGAWDKFDGSPEEKARQILEVLKEYRDKEAAFFQENGTTPALLDRLIEAPMGYVAHEFFATSWQPLVFAEVNAEMERIGLCFAGDGLLYSNYTEFSAPAEFHELLDRIPDRVQRESEKDFICNRAFRTDVFIRPTDESRPKDEFDALNRTLFGFNVTSVEVETEIPIYKGKVNLEGPWLDGLKLLLESEALTFAEILADKSFEKISAEDLRRGLTVLCSRVELCPFRSAETANAPSLDEFRIVPEFNQYFMSTYNGEKNGLFLVSPISGSGVFLKPFEVVLLLGLQANSTVKEVWDDLKRKDINPKFEGRALTGSTEDLAVISDIMESYKRGKLPKLAHLRIVEPS